MLVFGGVDLIFTLPKIAYFQKGLLVLGSVSIDRHGTSAPFSFLWCPSVRNESASWKSCFLSSKYIYQLVDIPASYGRLFIRILSFYYSRIKKMHGSSKFQPIP